MGIAAARTRPALGEVAEAMVIRHPAATGVGLALGRSEGAHGLDTWADLYRLWRSAVPEGMPECLFFWAGGTPDGTAVRRTLLAAGLDCWRDPYPMDGAARWEWESPTGPRVLAVLAAADRLPALDRLVWRPPHVSPLAHHWLNTVLLREQRAERERLQEELWRARDAVETRGARLAIGSEISSLDGAESTLTEASAELMSMVGLATGLRDLRRVVTSLRYNMDQRRLFPAGEGVFGADAAEADLLLLQTGQTLEHVETAQVRAEARLRSARGWLTLHQSTLLARQQRVNTVQAALVAALLAVIGALTTFGVDARPPVAARLPLVLTLFAVVVAAPLVATRWYDRRLPVTYRLVTGLAAGTAVWACLAWTGAGFWAPVAGLGAAAVTGTVLALKGRVRRGRGSGQGREADDGGRRAGGEGTAAEGA
ncbi:CATRA conflict system CASPASE/TPR repeat-associated protein [Microbispora sp. NPDC046933]|uniref:CATRA conflict system CASPASE/TPR repeat-associated protein n=1 Tax=Microbispora sp. NPDC046933 TaxID=3155618 RepID=UPI0033CFBB79